MTGGYEALRNGFAWLDLRARGRILARGRDRARFLHNVTSNDIKKMAVGDSCYAFLLSPQGRIQADVWLLCQPDHFLIDTEPELREKVRQQILKYKVADQIELEDVTESTAAIGVEGPLAKPLATLHPFAPFTITGQPGYRIYSPAEAMPEIVSQLESAGAMAATMEEARTVRIENGKPRYGEDIRETSLVQETQQMHAVSLTKGCYLGQEIVERVRAQGHVNKKLVPLEIEGTEPLPAGTKVSGTGEVTSSVYSPRSGKVAALAYVRTPQAEPGTMLDAGGRAARVL
jgi:folate-binding protein YgfZ